MINNVFGGFFFVLFLLLLLLLLLDHPPCLQVQIRHNLPDNGPDKHFFFLIFHSKNKALNFTQMVCPPFL